MFANVTQPTDADESSGKEAGSVVPDFRREEVHGQGSEHAEEGRKKHADVLDVNRQGQHVGDPVDDPGCKHKTGVDGSSNNAPERVPRPHVKPVQEVVESDVRVNGVR